MYACRNIDMHACRCIHIHGALKPHSLTKNIGAVLFSIMAYIVACGVCERPAPAPWRRCILGRQKGGSWTAQMRFAQPPCSEYTDMSGIRACVYANTTPVHACIQACIHECLRASASCWDECPVALAKAAMPQLESRTYTAPRTKFGCRTAWARKGAKGNGVIHASSRGKLGLGNICSPTCNEQAPQTSRGPGPCTPYRMIVARVTYDLPDNMFKAL